MKTKINKPVYPENLKVFLENPHKYFGLSCYPCDNKFGRRFSYPGFAFKEIIKCKYCDRIIHNPSWKIVNKKYDEFGRNKYNPYKKRFKPKHRKPIDDRKNNSVRSRR